MNEKQIFAAVEVSDHEVRLVVGEFFNTRFNIIKVERVACSGMDGEQVVDPDAVSAAVKKAVSNAQKMIGAGIKKAILAIPSCGMKKYSYKTTVSIDGIDKTVTVQDIRKAMDKAASAGIDPNLALIQVVNVRYLVNGIYTRRIPIGEKCDSLTVDVDLLCANKKVTYDLVGAVEKAGIKVLDIFLDIYAVGKEAALFEQSMNRQEIVLKVERCTTTLGLLNKGRLTAGIVIPAGIGALVQPLVENYGIEANTAVELFKYSVRLNADDLTENPVHIWGGNTDTKTLSEKELVNSIRPNVNLWLDYMQKTCSSILQAGETTVMITGEGGETQGLSDLLAMRLGCEVRNYIPDTLGGRNACLSAALGLFYAYQDRLPIMGYTDDSIDMDAFIKAVSYKDKKSDGNTKEDTLTSKLKGLFLDGKSK